MLGNLSIDFKSKTPIYLQIVDIIISQIEKGELQHDTILPSINRFNKQNKVARDTVEKSYKELRKRGYLHSVKGKGYFVIAKENDGKLRVLFILNKISLFKKIIYYSFLDSVGDSATVDLQIHHYKPSLLKDIIDQNLGKYNYFVVMPHFETSTTTEVYMDVIKRIPQNELILIDKAIPEYPESKGVYQDFRNDSYNALIELKDLISKYKSIFLLFPEDSNHPLEIIEGIQQFSKEHNHPFELESHPSNVKLTLGSVYIVLSDDDLVVLIKKIRKSNYTLGKDIGIIAFNETDLKDLLDITVISTDFEQMGKSAAELIVNNRKESIKNPFYIVRRGSL